MGVCSRCRHEIKSGDATRHGYGGETHEATRCVELLRGDIDRIGRELAQSVAPDVVIDRQVAAMFATIENVARSLESYLEAVDQSEELRARLATAAANELRGAFDLILRRARAVAESARPRCVHLWAPFDSVGGPLDGVLACSKCGATKPAGAS